MNSETRIFFKVPADSSLAPSLADKRVSGVFSKYLASPLDPVSSQFPEIRTDHYLVVEGKFGGFVGVKLRNQRKGSSRSKLEVKTCISEPLAHQDLKSQDGVPVPLPPLAGWEKIATSIQGSVDANLGVVRGLMSQGGKRHTEVGPYAAHRLAINPQSKKLVQVVLTKRRLQGYQHSFAYEETDIQVSLINGPPSSSNNAEESETWRSWAFEGGSKAALEPIAENWQAIFENAVKQSMQSARGTGEDKGVAGDSEGSAATTSTCQIASYPEFVQSVYLDRLQRVEVSRASS